jgi:hypothetical protein
VPTIQDQKLDGLLEPEVGRQMELRDWIAIVPRSGARRLFRKE